MKIRLFCLGLILPLLISCAAEKPPRLPEFGPEATLSLTTGEIKTCAAVYPEGRWQFTHLIEFTLADGATNRLIGVTVLDADAINCVLMTIEGLTLFAARFTDTLAVLRAVPPFDRPAFAAGLMDDVRAIFVRPPAKDIRYGRLLNNRVWYRITADDGQVTDVFPADADCWRINTYGPELIKTRTIIARSCKRVETSLIPEKLELTVPGPTGYTLKMNLLSAEKMNNTTMMVPQELITGDG